jgi:hypothetical protein
MGFDIVLLTMLRCGDENPIRAERKHRYNGHVFCNTDDGKVLTVLNVGRESVKTVVIQEIQVFDEPIREMLFLGGSPPKLLISSDGNLKLLNVRQCFTSRIKSCR